MKEYSLEEFLESEIIFSDSSSGQNASNSTVNFLDHHSSSSQRPLLASKLKKKNKMKKKKKKKNKKTAIDNFSVPMKIPESISRDKFEDFKYSYEDHNDRLNQGTIIGLRHEEMVPPHVIVSRRVAEKMACLVCVDNGRNLQGRNLCQVRDSILRMTGFLEA